MGEPGGLPSMGSHRVRHDWSDLAAAAAFLKHIFTDLWYLHLAVSTSKHYFELSQCTSPKHPVSCIEPGLATHFLYDIIHVSMPFSQIIPPSPSPTESKSLFYTSVSLLLSRIQGYHYHLSKFNIYTVLVFFFLAYFTLYNRLQFHPPQNCFKCILFNGWVILHCVYVSQLSCPFICWWASQHCL